MHQFWRLFIILKIYIVQIVNHNVIFKISTALYTVQC